MRWTAAAFLMGEDADNIEWQYIFEVPGSSDTDEGTPWDALDVLMAARLGHEDFQIHDCWPTEEGEEEVAPYKFF